VVSVPLPPGDQPSLTGMNRKEWRKAIHLMKVKHAVITSVDRDELKDGGSIIWYNTIQAVKVLNPDVTLETLIPDFKGKQEDIRRVIDAAPEVVSHNIETAERLTKQVRIQAKYWAQYGSDKDIEKKVA